MTRGKGRGYISEQKRRNSYQGKPSHSQSSYVKIELKTGNGDCEPRERIFFLFWILQRVEINLRGITAGQGRTPWTWV